MELEHMLPDSIEPKMRAYFVSAVEAFARRIASGWRSKVPLHVFATEGYQKSTSDRLGNAAPSPEVIDALRAAAEAFGGDDDKADRYARACALLDKWANENTEFDARVAPQIEEALKGVAPQPCPDCARLRALLGEAYVVLKRSELVASFALCPRLKKDIEALIARIAAEVEDGK